MRTSILAVGMGTLLSACSDGAILSSDHGLKIDRYDAIAIAEAGGGMRLSASKLDRYDLIAIAQASAKTNAHIIVSGASKFDRYDMIAISKEAPGLVSFED